MGWFIADGKPFLQPYVFSFNTETQGSQRALRVPCVSVLKKNLDMKNILAITCALLLTSFVFTSADDILGTWSGTDGKGNVQIYKQDGKYFGRIVWLKEPNDANGKPKTDAKNPDDKLKSRPLIGAIVLRDFIYDKGEWNSGRIYDPQNGKDYKCYLKLKDANTLLVRGYIGISLIGRTETWTRLK